MVSGQPAGDFLTVLEERVDQDSGPVKGRPAPTSHGEGLPRENLLRLNSRPILGEGISYLFRNGIIVFWNNVCALIIVIAPLINVHVRTTRFRGTHVSVEHSVRWLRFTGGRRG